jgi:hypothetical protein
MPDLHAAAAPPMRLAICAVYGARPGSEWIARLQLRKIAETTTVEHRVFAAAPRATARMLAVLGRRDTVEIADLPEPGVRGSAEHAWYLDRLVAAAAGRGYTHFATLDVDSFPIRRGWAEALAARLGPSCPFAAAQRAENGEIALPHPSGLLCRTDFWQAARPVFLPDRRSYFLHRPGFFLRHRERRDTGIGYAIAAWRRGADWLRLPRSNRRNDHRLMAGVYGGMLFHLGSMSREPLFECDWWATPRGRLLWRTRHLRLFAGRRRAMARAMVAANRETRARIVAALRADADGYLAAIA